jgi:hypothetical protein
VNSRALPAKAVLRNMRFFMCLFLLNLLIGYSLPDERAASRASCHGGGIDSRPMSQ